MSLPNPVRPSSLIRVGRWSLLGLGIYWGSSRQSLLEKKEAKLREIAEKERPAKEAAGKAEKEKKNQEELAYLQSLGINLGAGSGGGGTSGVGGSSGSGPYSDCGCD